MNYSHDMDFKVYDLVAVGESDEAVSLLVDTFDSFWDTVAMLSSVK